MKNKQIPKFKNTDFYVQGFNGCQNFIHHAIYGGIIDSYRLLGYGYTQFLGYFEKGFCGYGYYNKDLKSMGNNFLIQTRLNKNYLQKIIKRDKKLSQNAIYLVNKIDKKDLSKLPIKTLLEIYAELWKKYYVPMGISHVIEPAAFAVENKFNTSLEKDIKIKKQTKEFSIIFNQLMQPLRKSFLSKEIVELMRLDLKLKKIEVNFKNSTKKIIDNLTKKQKKLIKKHNRKHLIIGMNYYHANLRTIEETINEIKKISGNNSKYKIKKIQSKYKDNKKIRKKLIKKYNLSKETTFYLNYALRILHWQDDRKVFMLTCVYGLNKILTEFAKRKKIDLKLLKTFLPEEINTKLLNNFDKKLAKERFNTSVFYFNKTEKGISYEVFTKEQAKEIIKKLKLKSKNTDFHGTAANMGKVQGRVKICKTKDDLKKVKKGNILVAVMTRPEFMPAIQRSAAIITDEGGITCHAAIISRELNKPCVIGTKIATEVLKDDELVEVNANHGIIRKLSK